jgi:hypothetical protein
MSYARITDFGCWLRQSKLLKACQEKLKCQTILTLVMRKDQSAHFKGLDLQVAEIKDLKAVYSLMYYVALFRA